MDETIAEESNLGQRLGKLKRSESRYLFCNGKNIPLTTRITIGRISANNIIIDDNMVSRRHAVIQKIRNSYFLIDLNSKNGSFVNGKQVPPDKYIRLRGNDLIKIGRTELDFR